MNNIAFFWSFWATIFDITFIILFVPNDKLWPLYNDVMMFFFAMWICASNPRALEPIRLSLRKKWADL